MAFFPALVPAFRALLETVRGQPVTVVGHARPDGDCIGSQVGLALLLQPAAASVRCLNADAVPRTLRFLTENLPFTLPADWEPDGSVVIFCDCADEQRPNASVRARTGPPQAQIDHHLTNAGYARLNLVDPTAAATAEIIAGLAFDAGLEVPPRAAEALYTGIVTDTGRFGFPSTSGRVFALAGRLLAAGARPATVAHEVYGRQSRSRLELLRRFLASLAISIDGRVAHGLLRQEDFRASGATNEDTEGLVDYAREIDGVEVGLLVEDRGPEVKVSLRCHDPATRVDVVAREFGGGGHACAAAFRQPGPVSDLLPRLLRAVEARLAAS